MVEDSVTGPYPTTYLITLNGRKYDKQIQLSLTYFRWWGQNYYSCHLWSMNMKRTNYLGVTLWMDRVCKCISYSWWWTTLHCKGQRGRRRYWRWTPPVVSSVAINSSPRAAFIRLYWWREHQHSGFLLQPHKWWRQMHIDLIKSGPDYMKIEGGNWRWMYAMAANSSPCLNPQSKHFADMVCNECRLSCMWHWIPKAFILKLITDRGQIS